MYINIYVFGDSITWGCWDSEKGGWVERLKIHFSAKNYRKNFRIYTYNLSIGGDTTNWLLNRFKNEIQERVTQNKKERKFDVIIFAIGMNDSRKISFDKFQKNLSELTKQAKSFTQKIIFIGLTKVDKSETFPVFWDKAKLYDNKTIGCYNSAIRNFCKKNKIHFVSIFNLLDRKDLEDGVHPNSQGHQKIFEKVKNFLIENKLVGDDI